jgi:hypothetical protein
MLLAVWRPSQAATCCGRCHGQMPAHMLTSDGICYECLCAFCPAASKGWPMRSGIHRMKKTEAMEAGLTPKRPSRAVQFVAPDATTYHGDRECLVRIPSRHLTMLVPRDGRTSADFNSLEGETAIAGDDPQAA